MGRNVYCRICAVDLEVVGAVYHNACWTNFKREDALLTLGRAPSDEISKAMEIIYNYLEGSNARLPVLFERTARIGDK